MQYLTHVTHSSKRVHSFITGTTLTGRKITHPIFFYNYGVKLFCLLVSQIFRTRIVLLLSVRPLCRYNALGSYSQICELVPTVRSVGNTPYRQKHTVAYLTSLFFFQLL